MRFGHFTAEALQEFAEAKGLDTKNQDFSEGVFDFKVCQKPNGERYGIPDQDTCQPPNREASRPNALFGLLKDDQQSHDAAKKVGDKKTKQKEYENSAKGKEEIRKAAYKANAKKIAAAVKAEKDSKAANAIREKVQKLKEENRVEQMLPECKDGGLTPDQCDMYVRAQKRKAAGPTWSGEDRYGFQRQ